MQNVRGFPFLARPVGFFDRAVFAQPGPDLGSNKRHLAGFGKT
jgi:hypothetical protein